MIIKLDKEGFGGFTIHLILIPSRVLSRQKKRIKKEGKQKRTINFEWEIIIKYNKDETIYKIAFIVVPSSSTSSSSSSSSASASLRLLLSSSS